MPARLVLRFAVDIPYDFTWYPQWAWLVIETPKSVINGDQKGFVVFTTTNDTIIN